METNNNEEIINLAKEIIQNESANIVRIGDLIEKLKNGLTEEQKEAIEKNINIGKAEEDLKKALAELSKTVL